MKLHFEVFGVGQLACNESRENQMVADVSKDAFLWKCECPCLHRGETTGP